MPKTLASKKTTQQKKILLGEDDETASGDHFSNDIPTKTGKLSNQDDELKKSTHRRPRCQTSCVTKSKIQQSVKIANDLQRKRRRPNADRSDADNNVSSFPDSSSVQDLLERSGKRMMDVLPEARVVLKRLTSQQLKDAASNAVKPQRASLRLRPKEKVANKRRPFVLENSEKGNKSTRQSAAQILAPKTLDKAKRIVVAARDKSLTSATRVKMKSGSPDLSERKSKKKANYPPNFVKSKDTSPPLMSNFASEPTTISPPLEISETFFVPDEPAEQEISPIKHLPVIPAFVEEVPCSPRKKGRPRKVPIKIDLRSNNEKTVPDTQSSKLNLVSDPDVLLKKNVRKARKPVEESSASAVASTAAALSPHASRDHFGNDVPTKEELSNEDNDLKESIRGKTRRQASCVAKLKIQQCVTMGNNLKRKLRRPTTDHSDADSNICSFQEPSSVQDLSKHSGKRMMGVFREARVVLKRLTSQQLREAGKKSTRQSVAQILARKSLDKAKNIVVATRNKLLTSATDNEATESLNVHVNPNTETLMSKFRFATASGSSGSSSSSSNQYVSMTQGKPVANIITGIVRFTGTKPVEMMPTKANEEEELKRKQLELKREKEEEAARKREEYLKAKANEKKRKHEVRAKRVSAKRTLPANAIIKQHTEDQEQKLENKKEKRAHLKQKMQVENQEKAERQAEVEIATVDDVAVPGPSMLNTTFTLPSSLTSNYQISPVRVTKNGKLFNPDYDIGDMRSDDSPDNCFRSKKNIPTWAKSSNLKVALKQQAKANIDPDQIFPGDMFLKGPNLNDMFMIKRERFSKRTSSADWETSPSNTM